MNFEILLHLELNSKTTKNATHTTKKRRDKRRRKTNFVVAKNITLPFKLKTSVKVILLPELFLEEESNSFV